MPPPGTVSSLRAKRLQSVRCELDYKPLDATPSVASSTCTTIVSIPPSSRSTWANPSSFATPEITPTALQTPSIPQKTSASASSTRHARASFTVPARSLPAPSPPKSTGVQRWNLRRALRQRAALRSHPRPHSRLCVGGGDHRRMGHPSNHPPYSPRARCLPDRTHRPQNRANGHGCPNNDRFSHVRHFNDRCSNVRFNTSHRSVSARTEAWAGSRRQCIDSTANSPSGSTCKARPSEVVVTTQRFQHQGCSQGSPIAHRRIPPPKSL